MGQPIIEFEDGSKIDLAGAAQALASRGGHARPYDYRVESAANAETGWAIHLYGLELGSRSEAIRDLLARGIAAVAAERAVQA